MYIDPLKVETMTFVLDLEEGHPVRGLFLWFPHLWDVPSVRELFHLMNRTFGERLRPARVNEHLGTAESLHAQEIRCLLTRFQQECPIDVIEGGARYNLRRLFRNVLDGIKRVSAHEPDPRDAARQFTVVFCQLLLAIGLSPTAP